ncbi:hypothetical protein D5S18_33925 [Nocardia panacis]|uniref:MmpS family membrane protein n=1 Tax=Nocardia panacis TaxID=2340916 RepID=A0A3A4KHI1_9NOCA|nr:MmpS family transport accessory protein [Nocardia panacis]RJO68405.1 hypothetical protein D5S18_33925 [Nocardia panacis]
MTYQPPPSGPQGYYPPPQYPPRRSRPLWPWVLGVVALVVVALVGGGVVLLGAFAVRTTKEARHEVSVVYEVTGSAAAADIAYYHGQFDNAVVSGGALPWRKEVLIVGLATPAGVSASGAAGETMSCRILRDGKVLASESSSGPTAYVNCFLPFVLG